MARKDDKGDSKGKNWRGKPVRQDGPGKGGAGSGGAKRTDEWPTEQSKTWPPKDES